MPYKFENRLHIISNLFTNMITCDFKINYYMCRLYRHSFVILYPFILNPLRSK